MAVRSWVPCWRLILALWGGGVLFGGGAGGVLAEEVEGEQPAVVSEEVIAVRIAELDDEKFAVREKARAALLEIGRPALPLLREATRSESPEQRVRASQLVDAIHVGMLRREFAAIGKGPETGSELEHGMWLIAMILDPDLPREPITTALDEMAAAVRKAMGEGVELARLPPAQAMAVLTRILRDEFELRGDEQTYDDPANSSIHRVLERKKGLPILLSEIAVAVARRLDLPVVGLAIPGRYMIKYEGARAPEGEERADIIVNPFEGWRITSPAELARTIPGFDPRTDLAPSPVRGTLVRMLSNLSADLYARGDLKQIPAIREYQVLLLPEGVVP